MKQSNLLIPDLQRMLGEKITEESQRFLVKSGFLGSFQDNQYVFLPLAMRVIEKIKIIVTEQLEKLKTDSSYSTTCTLSCFPAVLN